MNRTSTTWNELIDIQEQFDAIAFQTTWDVSLQRNASQNDRRQQTGKGSASLDYESEEYGGWSFGSAANLNRRSSRTDFLRQEGNDTELDLVISSGAAGEYLRRRLTWTEEMLTWDITGSAGVTRDFSATERRSRREGNPLDRADSTDASGGQREISTALYYAPREFWSLTVDAKANLGTEEYTTDLVFPDSSAVLEGDNRDENHTFRMTASWNRDRGTKIVFRQVVVRDVSQEFSTSEQAQDTRTGTEQSYFLDLKGEPFWGIAHDIQISQKVVDTGFALSDRGAGRDGYSIGGVHDVKLGRVWGPMQKTGVEVEWGWGQQALTYDSGNSYDRDTANGRIKLERPFGKKLVVTVQAQSEIEQAYYEDGGGNDRDIFSQRFESNFEYEIGKNVDSKVNVFWKKKRTLNIRAAKALANTDETNITVTSSYDWEFRPGLKLIQSYQVTAVSSELPFDDSRSTLARTSQLQTNFESQVGPKLGLSLEHKFRFRDSGRFELDDDGLRRFAKETEGTQQWLEVEANYRVRLGFTLFINQKYDVRVTESASTGRTSRRPRTELRWGGALNHKIDELFGITAKFDRVNSTDELSYWQGQASVSKVF